jgi:GNAT superfamily N-acetyltransferase
MAEIGLKTSKEHYSLMLDGVSVGGAWVGMTTIVPLKEFMDKKSKVVMGFSIQHDMRNKGLGKALMEKIIESERDRGTTYLCLGVEINNEHAIRLYESVGFQKDGPLYSSMHYMWIKL